MAAKHPPATLKLQIQQRAFDGKRRGKTGLESQAMVVALKVACLINT